MVFFGFFVNYGSDEEDLLYIDFDDNVFNFVMLVKFLKYFLC